LSTCETHRFTVRQIQPADAAPRRPRARARARTAPKPTSANVRLQPRLPRGSLFSFQQTSVMPCLLARISHSIPTILRNGGGPACCRGILSSRMRRQVEYPEAPWTLVGSTIGLLRRQRQAKRNIRMIGSCRGTHEPILPIRTIGSIPARTRPRPQRRAPRRSRQANSRASLRPAFPIGHCRRRTLWRPIGRSSRRAAPARWHGKRRFFCRQIHSPTRIFRPRPGSRRPRSS
jgi:hypothetical protein